jgi:hypothetical protein
MKIKNIKNIKNIAIALLAVLAIACSVEDPERADYISFQAKTVEMVAPATGSGDAELKIFALEPSGSSRTFSIEVDAATTATPDTYTVPETVTIPANSTEGTFSVTSDAVNIGKKIVLKFVPDESTIVGTSMTINIFEECLDNLLFMDIKFDIYCEEFAWQIWDTNTEELVAGNVDFGEYPRVGTGAPNPPITYRLAQIRERICLPAGSYIFVAYDAYGDGLSDGTNLGWFALRKVSDGSTLASGEGAFEDGKEFDFILP